MNRTVSPYSSARPAIYPGGRLGWRQWRTQAPGYTMGFTGLGRLNGHGLGSTQDLIMSLPKITTATLKTAGSLGVGWATAAVPIVGPIVAGVTIGLSFLFARKGPKQKVATTQIVDQVEPLMMENLNGYLNGPRTRESQLQALANFDAGWQFIVEHCQIPEMGSPGQRCVTDRQSGSCVWRDAQGECWNWFKGYRDPIANDPSVRDSAGGSTTGSGFQVVGSGLDSKVILGGPGGVTLDSKVLLGAGAIILGLAMSGGHRGGRYR